jgi:hypothetical protein
VETLEHAEGDHGYEFTQVTIRFSITRGDTWISFLLILSFTQHSEERVRCLHVFEPLKEVLPEDREGEVVQTELTGQGREGH